MDNYSPQRFARDRAEAEREDAERFGRVIAFPLMPRGTSVYIDRAVIEAACEALEQEVGAIVIGSNSEFGAIDPLAYEINAHLVAIRRAISEVPENG